MGSKVVVGYGTTGLTREKSVGDGWGRSGDLVDWHRQVEEREF